MKKSIFISIEGGEGAGKSSLIRRLTHYFSSRGLEVLATREPGGVKIAEQIRAILLDKDNTALDGRTEALLYAAARRQHWVEVIAPALNGGKAVLCDRFIDSSLAYQGAARGLGLDAVLEVNRFAIGDGMPDLTLYLDIAPEAGLARIHGNRQREVNRLDLEALDFHRRVREGYLRLLERFPERMVLIHAEHSPDRVAAEAEAVLTARWFS